eukprot:TRINITY_DN641_c0_g1_i4.p1 TRINITY_DN641_c0_g1~~TRINITY_DN641_c0_g1_i4.p1  ORF type:complete len:2132 (+),score=403.94 TRINITY_DN641_c0_g1_i4:93-6488(+)
MRCNCMSWGFLVSWLAVNGLAWVQAEDGLNVGPHSFAASTEPGFSRRLAGTSSGGIIDDTLIGTIHMVERMEMWEQRMTQEFLLVIYGYEVEEYKQRLRTTIQLFDDAFHDLETGDASKNVMKPPDDGVVQQLASISKEWLYYRGLLEKNYNLLLGHHKSSISSDAGDPALAEAMLAFKQGWDASLVNGSGRQGLVDTYTNQSPSSIGDEAYHTAHQQYHSQYSDILSQRQYSDLLFLDVDGNVIYSVQKNFAYGTNVNPNGTNGSIGQWAASGLGVAFGAAFNNPEKVNVADWAGYGLSGGLASFLSTGIVYDDHLIGVLITQLPAAARATASEVLDVSYIEKKNDELLTSLQLLLKMYVAHAEFSNLQLPASESTAARRQELIIQQMMKDAMFAIEDVKREYYLEALYAAENQFDGTHESLLWGDPVSGLVQMTSLCTLHSMYTVSKDWQLMQKYFRRVRHIKAVKVPVSLVASLESVKTHLESAMAAATHLIEHYDGSCKVQSNLTSTQWKNGLKESVTQRYLVQKISRLFFKIALEVDVDSNKVTLVQTVADAENSMRRCAKGSVSADVPPPPTQEIADYMKSSWKDWLTFSVEAMYGVQTNAFTPAIVTKLARYSYALDLDLDKAALAYIAAAEEYYPKIRPSVVGTSQKQLVLLHKMLKEAALVSLGEDVEFNQNQFAYTKKYFDQAHWWLLSGRPASASVPAIPRTVDDCTLVAMERVLTQFQGLRSAGEALVQVAAEGNQSKTYTSIKYLDSKFELTYGEMDFAAQLYMTGNNTCNTKLPRLVWEVTIDEIGHLPYRFQVAQTKMALLSNGVSATWKDQTKAVLKYQKSSTATEAAANELADAFAAFTTGWAEFRGTDDERRLGLQVAYITLNSNPEGEKAKLDYAPGQEVFHVAHRIWHPRYRSILNDHGYYDIYFLDLNGNCIYSVNKETDFGTNFAADGNGRWKDSGLGEAFRLALADPDQVHVTDWKPYKPSAGASAQFVSSAIKRDGQLIGVYVTRMPETAIPVDSLAIMTEEVNAIQSLIHNLKYGNASANISPPALQKESDLLHVVSDRWDTLDSVFREDQSFYSLSKILGYNDAFVSELGVLEEAYIEGAYQEDSTLPGAKMHLASKQLVLLQSMCKEVVLLDIAKQWVKSSAEELENHRAFAKRGAALPEVIEAISHFKQAWTDFAETHEERRDGLQQPYIFANPYSADERDKLISVNGSEAYHVRHRRHHPIIRDILYKQGLYDILFLDLDGNCIYSVHKGIDFATNFAASGSGQWKDSGLGRAFRKALQSPDDVAVEDWAAYGPAGDKEASFLATGIRQDGTLIGVFVAELPTAAKPDDFGASGAHLQKFMDQYEANHDMLVDGNSRKRRLAGGSDIAATTSQAGKSLLAAVQQSWNKLKVPLQEVVAGVTLTTPRMKNVVDLAAVAVEDMAEATTYFSSTTRTTTKVLLEILSPIPLTGDWAGGRTMRVGALLAEALINEDQIILPGYELKHTFFNDQCDPGMSTEIVLGEMASKSTYISFAGAGCSEVCAQSRSVAASIRLPFLSYECPGEELSDTLAYPDLTRMGTVTTPFPQVIRNLADKHDWSHVFVISGDPSKYREEATKYQDAIGELGLSTEYLYALDSEWNEIESMMNEIKDKTKGKDRVFLVVGTETYFRKLVCASIKAGLRQGITWISQGTWRNEWWKKSSMAASFQRQWIREDTLGNQLRQAFAAFKTSWDGYAATADQTRTALQFIYHEENDPTSSETYHAVHTQWHPVFRLILADRNYNDLYMFDTAGDLIYSVNKKKDYATNFVNGPWKDSGLGEAFRAAMDKPDEVTFVDRKPSSDDQAFFARGIRDRNGKLVGVYAIQVPDVFEKSIEQVQPECTLDAISEAFEGAINIAGLGRPEPEDMGKPLPCFEGHSPSSLMNLLDFHLEKGYPEGDLVTQVRDPYNDIKTHAMDATCALAFTVRHLLSKGFTAEQIQRPDAEVYKAFNAFLRTQPGFQGLSGEVKFVGNDKENHLSIQQVQKGESVDVGLRYINSTIAWIGNGADNSSWTQEFEDPPNKFEYWLVIQISIPAVILCLALSFGVHMGIKRARAIRGEPIAKKSDDMLSMSQDASDATQVDADNNTGNPNQANKGEEVENVQV